MCNTTRSNWHGPELATPFAGEAIFAHLMHNGTAHAAESEAFDRLALLRRDVSRCLAFLAEPRSGDAGFVGKGYLGVELLFVLSGFILSHVYLEKLRAWRFSYREFLWARLARIYPLHTAMIAGLAVLILARSVIGVHGGDQLIIRLSLPAHLTSIQALGQAPQDGWNDPFWSISAKWLPISLSQSPWCRSP